MAGQRPSAAHPSAAKPSDAKLFQFLHCQNPFSMWLNNTAGGKIVSEIFL
jgi:hypothetical protein